MNGRDGLRRRRQRMDGDDDGDEKKQSMLTRSVSKVLAFVRYAEFEILFILFVLIAFIVFKDLISRPEYNDILVKKPGGDDFFS